MTKRLLLIILTLIMVTAMLPSAMAAESNALSLLNYEMISPQAPDCISENLKLPDEIGGESISWTSSDTSVISTSGAITRPESEPEEVTITATAGGKNKEFNFTVVPENYYVHYSESFDYSKFPTRVITKLLPDWVTRMGNADYPSSKFRNETLSDGSTNCYIKNEMWKDRPQYHLNGTKPSGKIKVSYKVYMDAPDKTEIMYDYKFFFSKDSYTRMRFKFSADKKVNVTYNGKGASEVTVGSTSFDELNLLDRWVKMDWILDTDSKKLWLYIDGKLMTKEDGLDSPKMVGPLEIVDFDLGANVLNSVISIDNVSVVTMCENSAQKDVIEVYDLLALEDFSSESKFAVTENLDFSNVSYIESNGVNITYKSGSDNLVIEGDTGRIIPAEEDDTAILYATITKDGADISRTKTFEFTIKGSKYKVYDSESFYYPDFAGQRTTTDSGKWALTGPPQNEGALDSAYVKEPGNCSVKSFRQVSDSSYGGVDQNYFCYWFKDTSKRDVTIEARFKTGTPKNTQRQIYVVNLCGKYGTSNYVRSYTQMHFYMSADATVSMDASAYVPESDANKTKVIASSIACPGEWFDFKMEIDMFAKTFSIYINGKCMTPTPLNFTKESGVADTAEASELVYFCANPFRTMSESEIFIDDFATYSERGTFADVVLYKNGVKISDLGYLSKGDTFSADVQALRFPDGGSDETSVVAAVYDGDKMYDVAISKGTMISGKYRASFPSLEFPESIENTTLKIFCMDSKGGITPLCEETVGEHKLNGTITPLEHTDSRTGRTYYTIDINGEDALRSYYTMPMWSSDPDKFYFYDRLYRLYEMNLATNKYRYIDTVYSESCVMVTKLGNLFYVNKKGEIIRQTSDREAEVVGTLPAELDIAGASLLQVNNDESYLSMHINERETEDIVPSKETRIPVMNINTGEWDLRFKHGFDVVNYAPNHINMNPNPEYSNIVAFAHEGRGEDCLGNPERIWVLDRNTGECTNLYKQKMLYDNVPAEVVSHEAWMQSGELMMFASGPKTAVPGGITLFKKDGSDRRYVNNDYDYLHASGSTVNDRFVVSDTGYNGTITRLVLIDCYTGKSYLLAVIPQKGANPGHTHPNFSFDGTKVIFGISSEDYKTMCIGWMDISDIIENVADGEEITLSDSCSTTSYGDTDFYLENTESGYYIKEGNHMNVNITSFEKETADIELTFDYVDSGTENIIIDYVKWENVSGSNKAVNYSETVERTNSSKIKTASVKLYGINAENLKLMGTDLTIKGKAGGVTVTNVKVREIKEN